MHTAPHRHEATPPLTYDPLRSAHPSMPLFSRAPTADAPARPPARPAQAPGRTPKAPKRPPMAQDVHVSPFFADHTRAGLADRLNELRERRSDSVLVAVCLSLCLLVSLGMNVFQAARSHIEPYMVVVDGSQGFLLDHGPLEPMDGVEDIYLQREIRNVITGLRGVTNDPTASVAQFNAAYAKVVQGSPGDAFLKDLYIRQGNHPLDLAGKAQRTVVEFTGPVPVEGTKTWTVQWIERTATGGGSAGVTEDLYRGSMTIEVVPVKDLSTAETNPLGVWIDGIQWEKVSSKYLDLEELGGLTPMDLLYPDPDRRPGAPGFEAPKASPTSAPATPAASGTPTADGS